jgi:polyribonucleotide nucleotidyltransferase
MDKVDEAERQIKLILNPPTAEVGAVYPGRVVNITKFGAFVNILPGRDGLLHISKMGKGKRIDKVEDVFDLGDVVEVKVDDVDPQGKVSLSLAGDAPEVKESNGSSGSSNRSSDAGSADAAEENSSGDREYVSFEDDFESELTSELGDLGPSSPAPSGGGDRGRSRGGRGRSGGRR